MKKKMNTEAVLEHLKNNSDQDAFVLLDGLDINAVQRFNRAVKMLENLVVDVRKTYPDAYLFVSDNSISLNIADEFTMPEHNFDEGQKSYIHNSQVKAIDAIVCHLEVDKRY